MFAGCWLLAAEHDKNSGAEMIIWYMEIARELISIQIKQTPWHFSPQANYSDRWPPLVSEVSANFCG
jgi:hypothetical protein